MAEREVAHYGCALINIAHTQRFLGQAEQVGMAEVAHYWCALRTQQYCALHSALLVKVEQVGVAEREVAHYGCSPSNIAHYTALSRSRRRKWVW